MLMVEIIIALLVTLFFVYGWFIEPYWLQVNRQEVEVAAKQLSQPLHLLFISDIHLGQFTHRATLRTKLEKVRRLHAQEPFDLLILGGDYLDHDPAYLALLKEVITTLSALKIPMIGVLGNHDYAAMGKNVDQLIEDLEELGLTILRNQDYTYKKGKDQLQVIGLDDLQVSIDYFQGKNQVPYKIFADRAKKLDWYQKFDTQPPEGVRITVGHNPDVIYLPGKIVPQLVISGHTHGGQFVFLDWLSKRFYRKVCVIVPTGSFVTWAGRRLLHKTTLLVSRGFDGSFIPFRFGRPPEVIAVTLKPLMLPKTLLIGLSGKPRVGKDTVAAMLETLFPGINRVAFANAIKEEYDTAHGTNTLHHEEEKVRHRMALHTLGDARRAEDRNYWVKKTLHHQPPLLITDVRLPQEVEAVKEAKGYLIRVESSEATMRSRMREYYEEHANHPNELWLDDYTEWDFVIHNDSSLEELERQVCQIAAAIRKQTGL